MGWDYEKRFWVGRAGGAFPAFKQGVHGLINANKKAFYFAGISRRIDLATSHS
jgi:hypothetical protein